MAKNADKGLGPTQSEVDDATRDEFQELNDKIGWLEARLRVSNHARNDLQAQLDNVTSALAAAPPNMVVTAKDGTGNTDLAMTITNTLIQAHTELNAMRPLHQALKAVRVTSAEHITAMVNRASFLEREVEKHKALVETATRHFRGLEADVLTLQQKIAKVLA